MAAAKKALTVNLGVGRETRIRDLAETIVTAAGFEVEVVWDGSMPDEQMRRGLHVSRARELLGFEAAAGLGEGIERTVSWFRERGPR